MPARLPANVVPLRRVRPALGRRDRARLDLIELLEGLDPDSQRVILEQLMRVHARVRAYTPTAALVRGELGPVAWRHDPVQRWLVGPETRKWLQKRAGGALTRRL